MSPRFGGRLPLGWAGVTILLTCRLCCCEELWRNDTGSKNTDCVPREIPDGELAAWVNEHSAHSGGRTPSLQRQQRRRRRRRGLLVSDTDCSQETLCHPTARPRVCYYNSDTCNGIVDCDTGRDELFCDDCLCPYQKVDGVTMDVPNSGYRYWSGINLKGCARACNDFETGCIAFSFNALRRGKDRCRAFFRLGTFIANNAGGALYLRDEPSKPRLAPSAQSSNAPPVPQTVKSANCSNLDMYKCGSRQECLPYRLLCDGIQQCPGGSEELLCPLFIRIFTRSPGRTLGSYSSPLPAPTTLATCAGYCLNHVGNHPKCLFFAYRNSSGECLIGCNSCGDSTAVFEDPDVDYYSPSLGGAVSLAGVLLEAGASSGDREKASDFERIRPTITQLTESLKTLGVTFPSSLPSAEVSRLFATGTQVSRPTSTLATAPPQFTQRPPSQGRPGASRPNNFVQGNSPNSGFSTSQNAPNAPSSSFGSFFGTSSVPSSTPQLPPTVVSQLPADCGRRPLAASATARTQTRVILSDGTANRVVNGQRATYGAYPWQAQIQVYSERGHFEHHCGGALIGERLVLTAAHCLRPALTRLQVKLGQHDRRDAGEQYEQTFAVENALTHPGYRSDPARGDADDLAVLKLRLRQGQAVRFSSHVQPLCLPSGPPPPTGQECHISGWGKTDASLPDAPSSAADVLHGATVPLVSDSLCSAREVYGERFVADRMVCAGHLAGGPDTCQGDSGGPLACPTADGRWQLTGIVSFGEGCGGLLKPGVYTRVEYYVSWIQRVVQLL